MKQYITTIFLGLGLCNGVLAGSTSPITPEYFNYGTQTAPPVVDATAFYNSGTIDIITALSANVTNVSSSLLYDEFSDIPFMTKDTLYFTNVGVLQGQPGFQFDTGTSTSRHPASVVFNSGDIIGVDEYADIYAALYSPPGSTAIVPIPALGQPNPSQIIVLATNIINQGSISVGDVGTLNIVGINVTNRHGTLAAGTVGDVGFTNFDVTGLQGQLDDAVFLGGPYYYLPSPDIYDLFWGVTNALSIDVTGIGDALPFNLPNIVTTARGLDLGPALPLNINAEFSSTATVNIVNGTNIYYNVVFVNTNIADTNISVTVGILPGAEFLQYASATVPPVEHAFENIVQFAEPVLDVISGEVVSNGVYLIDDGGVLPSMTLAFNASVPENYSRPNAFEVSTATPLEWDLAVSYAQNSVYSTTYQPAALWSDNTFNNNKQAFEISEYGVQVSHNPENISGLFSSLVESNSLTFDYLDYFPVNLPDPTNLPARIQLSARNLDISQARLRAEGMVIFNVTNLVGGGTAAEDFGEVNANIAVSNGVLTVSNLFPTTFQRVRGDIYAESFGWQNTQTNSLTLSLPGYNPNATNNWYYHVLVVDQNLFGSFHSTVRNLNLTGKKSIVLQDNLNVINSALINTTNLTIESSNYFGQNARDFTPATTPYLKNFFINTNGFLGADDLLDIGFNATRSPAAPQGRTYTVNTITNFGEMISPAPLLEAANFENDGVIVADSGGSVLVDANTLGLGMALPGAVNYLVADGSVELSAVSIQARNSTIYTGLGEAGQLLLTASTELTDLVSGSPTTNTNSVIINQWTVTGGFSLPVKPVLGDLFGTEIHTISTNAQYVTHVWAGQDRGPTVAGFSNNVVIGHLLLDRESSNSVLHFSAAGSRNAMYVDYLELTNYATNYHTGISIDPNFTIYFARASGDPQKLQLVYPNLVWVTNFVGPSSAFVVQYLPTNSGLCCLINSNVATSADIAFWPAVGANAYLLSGHAGLPAPYPYLLNNPSNPLDFIQCDSTQIRGTYAAPCDCVPGGSQYQLLYTNLSSMSGATNLSMDLLTVAYNGQGKITPTIQQSQLILGQSYTLTAKPAAGWVFDNWTLSMLGNQITSYSSTLTFAFVSNTVATANFIPSPFPVLEGAYNGLFLQTNGPTQDSSGAVSLTLTKTGAFSGKLLLGPATYTFSSQFSGAGMAQAVAKSKVGSLTLNLQLDVSNLTGEIIGDVTNSSDGWDASLAAYLAPAWTAKNPAPAAGNYTFSLPWTNGTDAFNEAGGDSYGTGTIGAQGVFNLTGALADGAAFNASAPVNLYNQWPLYIYAGAGQDSVLGWVTVSNGLSGTNITWFKPAFAGAIYPNGFTNVLQVTGALWKAAAAAATKFTLTNPVVFLSGGDLPYTIEDSVTTKNSLTYSATGISLTITAGTGKFTGWFDSPVNGKKTSFSGVVLTNQAGAFGFFLGNDQSGAVQLEGQ